MSYKNKSAHIVYDNGKNILKEIDFKYDLVTINSNNYHFGLFDNGTNKEFQTISDSFLSNQEWVSSKLYLMYLFSGNNKNINIQRKYPTIIDTLSGIGGMCDIMLSIFAIIYTQYVDYQFKHEQINKGILLEGKYGLSETESRYIRAVSREKSKKKMGSFNKDKLSVSMFYKQPTFKDKCKKCFYDLCKKVCWCNNCRKRFQDIDLYNDEEIANNYMLELDEYEGKLQLMACERIMDRQLDLKHLLQLFQDVEMIKRVLFKERHLVLAPMVNVEYEKSVLVKEKEKEENIDMLEKMEKSNSKKMRINETKIQPLNNSNNVNNKKGYNIQVIDESSSPSPSQTIDVNSNINSTNFKLKDVKADNESKIVMIRKNMSK